FSRAEIETARDASPPGRSRVFETAKSRRLRKSAVGSDLYEPTALRPHFRCGHLQPTRRDHERDGADHAAHLALSDLQRIERFRYGDLRRPRPSHCADILYTRAARGDPLCFASD